MNEPKAFASLGPTLLARKGAAKPAMRPQNPAIAGMSGIATAQNLEDLGWNDMGEPIEEEQPRKGEVLSLSPASPGEYGDDYGEDYIEEEDGPEIAPSTWVAKDDEYDEEEDEEDFEVSTPLAPQMVEPQMVEPEVVRQRQQLEQSFTAVQPQPLAAATQQEQPTPTRRPAVNQGRRAAFTLRLDEQRHLKLRLASTVKNRSAQQLVTEALDRLLAEMPELESLAAQVKRG